MEQPSHHQLQDDSQERLEVRNLSSVLKEIQKFATEKNSFGEDFSTHGFLSPRRHDWRSFQRFFINIGIELAANACCLN
jgi:hypothetical protein